MATDNKGPLVPNVSSVESRTASGAVYYTRASCCCCTLKGKSEEKKLFFTIGPLAIRSRITAVVLQSASTSYPTA
jgi:hypothetical protein